MSRYVLKDCSDAPRPLCRMSALRSGQESTILSVRNIEQIVFRLRFVQYLLKHTSHHWITAPMKRCNLFTPDFCTAAHSQTKCKLWTSSGWPENILLVQSKQLTVKHWTISPIAKQGKPAATKSAPNNLAGPESKGKVCLIDVTLHKPFATRLE